jgi:hypothetical protein
MEEERKDQEQEEREETVKDLEVSDEQAEDVKGGARMDPNRLQK